MRIIAINRYYRPDYSATAQMLTDLAEHLVATGRRVSVVTSRMTYDGVARLPAREELGGVEIHRIATTTFGRARLGGRAIDYATFYVSAFIALLMMGQRGDIVIAKTDPPLISIVAAIAAKLKGMTLVNWCQDLFPETAAALGMHWARGWYGQRLRGARNWSLRQARLNAVLHEKMAEKLRAEFVEGAPIRILRNWADANLRAVAPQENPLRREWGLQDRFVIGYSGNLGRAHLPDCVLQLVRATLHIESLTWLFIGGGVGLERIKAEIGDAKNVVFKPYQPRHRLSESLSVPDVHLISQDPACEGYVVPSKYYGVRAVGRKVLFLGEADGATARDIAREGGGLVLDPARPSEWLPTLTSLACARGRDNEVAVSACDTSSAAKALEAWTSALAECSSRPVKIRRTSSSVDAMSSVSETASIARTGHAFFWSALSAVALYVVGLSTGIISARVLGPVDRGLLGIILFWAQFLSSFAAISLADAMIVHLGAGASRAATVRAAYGASLAVVTVALPIGVLLIWRLTAHYGDLVVILAMIVFAVQLLELCAEQVSQGVLRFDQRFSLLNWLRASVPLIYLVCMCASVLLNLGLAGFVGSYVVALAVAFVLRLVVTLPNIEGGDGAARPAGLYGAVANLHLGAVLAMLASQLDRLFVVQTNSAESVAMYLIALSAAGPFQGFLSVAIKSVALPALVNRDGTQRAASARRLLRATWTVSVLGSIAVAAVSPIVVPLLFGADFAEAGVLAASLTLALAPLPVRHALSEILKSVGNTTATAIAETIYVGVFVVVFGMAWALGIAWPVLSALAAANVVVTLSLAALLKRPMPSVTFAWLVPDPRTFTDLYALARGRAR